MQGYLFCTPLPAEAFEQMLLEGRSLETTPAPGLQLSPQPAKTSQ
jgi:hypothetical protein